MAGDPNKYTDEYRQEAADYAISSGKPNAQIAKELGINKKTFNSWVVKRKRELDGSIPATTISKESDEIKELRRRNKELEQENEFLKKASAFFAKNLK